MNSLGYFFDNPWTCMSRF